MALTVVWKLSYATKGGLLPIAGEKSRLGEQSDPWVAMKMETKFLRLFRRAKLGDHIDGWRVCWVGGWDKCRVVFVVMVERPLSVSAEKDKVGKIGRILSATRFQTPGG